MRRIDLHCHTKATKKGDGRGRDVTPELFRKKIEQASIQIVAITNHNRFYLAQYKELSEAVHGVAQVWPGVELDVRGNEHEGKSNHWHMLAITSPKEAHLLDEIMNGLITDDDGNQKPADDCIWTIDEVWSAFKNSSAVFSSHCNDKKPYIHELDIDAIVGMSGKESWRFFYEPRTLKTLGIWANHNRSMLMGSDVKDWAKYEECEFVSLRLDVDSFEQFCLLAKRDNSVIETLLNMRERNDMTVHPHSGVSVCVPIYQDINVIFGQKGTGKSEIIKSLRAEYENRGLSTVSYLGGDKYEEYDRILSTSAMRRDPAMFGRSGCVEQINAVMQWTDEKATALYRYCQWIKTRGNDRKKDAFRLADSQKLPAVSPGAEKAAKDDLSRVEEFQKTLAEIRLLDYISEDEASTLTDVIEKLRTSIKMSYKGHLVERLSTDMANRSLAAIKSSIDKKSDTLSKPDDTGFLRFATKRIELKRTLDTVYNNVECCVAKTEKSPLGRLEDKGELYLVSRWRYLCDDSVAKEYPGIIKNLKKWKQLLEDARSKALLATLSESLDNLRQHVEDTGIRDLSGFIGVSKYPVLGNGSSPYSPSDGEKGIIVLEGKLREDAEVFLLDEPELGMSNSYVDTVIRPLIEGLAQARKTVIVATHNANLAVRTLPFVSIYRTHTNAGYLTYVGNPFRNKLVDVDNSESVLDWSECSMNTLEGGFEAFYDRKIIYEAGAN